MMIDRDSSIWGGDARLPRSLAGVSRRTKRAGSGLAPAKRPVVDAPAGKVEGQQDGKILVFKGIPYALPPVGQARWKPPTPMSRWTEVRKATEFGPACYQPTIAVQTVYTRGPLPMSEDCLTLNIWAPAGHSQRAGLFLDLRRRVDGRREPRGDVRWRAVGGTRHCRGLDQLPAGRVRLACAS